jgi:hypothetical protein
MNGIRLRISSDQSFGTHDLPHFFNIHFAPNRMDVFVKRPAIHIFHHMPDDSLFATGQ